MAHVCAAGSAGRSDMSCLVIIPSNPCCAGGRMTFASHSPSGSTRTQDTGHSHWSTSAAANIWCNPCTTREFVAGIRRRLVGIYAEHNPRKLDDVDALLEFGASTDDG